MIAWVVPWNEILSYQWRGFRAKTQNDPMGIGILNTLDLARGQYQFRIINVYLSSYAKQHGKATLHDRVQS